MIYMKKKRNKISFKSVMGNGLLITLFFDIEVTLVKNWR
jgi:hypothetical protein